jgi:coniferyl-aldehyde dehydrogenase
MNTTASALNIDVETQLDPQPETIRALLDAQRLAYRKDPMPSAQERIDRLQALKRMLLDNRAELTAAMDEDFSARAPVESRLAEFFPSVQGITYLCKKLTGWMKPEKRHLSLLMQPGKAQVHYQPVGVVGIMVPFNYPIFLAAGPLSTALAAGNRAMIKMPEATPRTSALFAKLIADTFSPDLITVVNGGPEVAATFSTMPYDHLLYTGSGAVGKHVMRAAAENLTPVTLELGGKSPVIVGDDFAIADAADRICYGKSMNAGQTCVAPDYIFVPRAKVDEFTTAYKESFNRFYPSLSNNPDYTGVISDRHSSRIQGWIKEAGEKGATIIPMTDEVIGDDTRRTVPVLLTNTDESMAIRQEEIFGPALLVLPYDSLDEAIDYINDRDRPLALYYFGFDTAAQQRILHETHSGGVVFNEVMFHVAVDDLPFGGIGPSGMGHYHGKEGFLTLSKPKAVLYKPKFNGMKAMYPPYKNPMIDKLFNWLLR